MHKNIAYKPGIEDELSGSGREVGRRRPIVERAARGDAALLGQCVEGVPDDVFWGRMSERWTLDYASYRPIEEQGPRPGHAEAQRPAAHGRVSDAADARLARFLRFFHNIHPIAHAGLGGGRARLRKVVGEFHGREARGVQRGRMVRWRGQGKTLAQAIGAGGTRCRSGSGLRTTTFMMDLHNAMKEDARVPGRLQLRSSFQFAAGSSWMVYTETVPHAVLAGPVRSGADLPGGGRRRW
jgi:hypothetical protein